MAVVAGLGALLKEIGIVAAATAGLELGARGIGWLWRKAATKWAARRGAQAAAQNIAKMEMRNLYQKALTNLEQRLVELRKLAEQARAAGNVTLERSYERQMTQIAMEHAKLAEVMGISREKWWDRVVALTGGLILLGFTGEEWRQTSMFRANLEEMKKMQAERAVIEREKMQVQMAMIEAMKARMQADEQNRAFWAWYLQQKQNLELMRQQALMMKQGLRPARGRAGRATSHVGDKLLLEQVKAYYKALSDARKRMMEWEKFWQQVNLEQLQALNQQNAIMMRARWDAWVESVKAAYKQQQELLETITAMAKEYQEAALKSQLQREEYALKAKLEEWQTMLAEHKARLEHALKMEQIEIAGQYERTNTAIAQAYEAVKQYLKSVAELEHTKKAKEVSESGKEKASQVRDEVSEMTRRILVEYGKELLAQLKRAGKLSLEPRKIVRTVAIYDPASALSYIYRR